jgi:N-acetyl-anhydromuramyl-L-alanine amidase AmpD
MKIDSAGWLVPEAGDPQVLKFPSSRSTQYDVATGGQPKGIVWHWTTGRCTTPQHANGLADSIRSFNKGDVAASWHVLIAKDGRLLQSVPFERGSWHVGRPGNIGGRLYGNINRATIGVELENSGKLMQVAGKFYCWPFWLDPDAPDDLKKPDPNYSIDSARAVPQDGEFYDVFPAAQIQSASILLRTLILKFKWTRDVSAYGHSDFDSPRKIDPGPVWRSGILPTLLDELFGKQ